MKILFMGTPDFSVPCLQALCDANHSVCGDGRELLVEEVQPEGSKRMPAASYFLGHPAYATTTVS